MASITAILAFLSLLAPTSAHMALAYPAPLRGEANPNYAGSSLIDYSITTPLSSDGSNFPCKGYQVDMTTSGGKAVAEWTAGNSYNYTLGGSAVHGGGSSQLALSNDAGVSWTVIHSYLGSNPDPVQTDAQTFDFTLPSDTPTTGSNGTIMAWLWYNVIGNREIYMSCASVNIAAGSSTRDAPAVAYSSRPDLFLANLGNGCTTVEGKEVEIPNPGPATDVTTKYTIADNSGSFTGTCEAVKGVGGETGSSSSALVSSGASSAASAASSVVSSALVPTTLVTSAYTIPQVPTASTSAASISPSPVKSSTPSTVSSAPASTGSSSITLTVSEDGSCGAGVTCQPGFCCSSYGFCGNSESYCGTGCQSGFGTCSTSSNSTSSVSARMRARFQLRA